MRRVSVEIHLCVYETHTRVVGTADHPYNCLYFHTLGYLDRSVITPNVYIIYLIKSNLSKFYRRIIRFSEGLNRLNSNTMCNRYDDSPFFLNEYSGVNTTISKSITDSMEDSPKHGL